MTSKKAMLSHPLRRELFRAAALALTATTPLLCFGCGAWPRRPVQPHAYASPYPGPKLWAVAPFRNEAGTTLPDGADFADKLTQQIHQIETIDVVPVNRVIEAMQIHGLVEIASVAQAIAVMQTLNVDGLLVGTLTAWNPYEPPQIGASVQLYARRRQDQRPLDSRQLTAVTSAYQLPGMIEHSTPLAQASHYFDAANGTVLRQLQDYARGRAPADSPSGWRRYLLSMDLYSEFVSHELMRRLFAAEWDRLTLTAHSAQASLPTPESRRP